MSSKPRVLVVDDSLTVRMDLRAALSTAGFAVSACSTKEEALRTLRSQAFDLAILDVALPDGNGIDLLKEIKLTPELRTLRVFMLSTEGEVRSRIRGLLQGADLYVGKPYDRGYVANKARALFKLSDRSGPPASRRALSNKNILIVDDCPKFAKALAAELRQRGNQVTLADTGEDALALLSIERFDCVFLDLIMPGLDGIETCRRLRALPRMDSIPVLLMASTDRPNLQTEALDAGADGVIVKLHDLSLMFAQMLGLLLKQRQQHPHAEDSGPQPPLPRPSETFIAPTLYQQVVARIGLSSLLSRSVVERAMTHLGVPATGMTLADLQRALPYIGEALHAFLPHGETTRRMAEIAALCGTLFLSPWPAPSARRAVPG